MASSDQPWDAFKYRPGYQMELPLQPPRDNQVVYHPELKRFAPAPKVVVDPLRVRISPMMPDWADKHNHDGYFHECAGSAGFATHQSSMLDDGPGWVYFIENQSTGSIKIGRSGQDPAKRLANLQTGCDGELRLLRKMFTQTMMADENCYQKRFETSHLRGEWFLPSGELLDFIERGCCEKEKD